MLIHQSVGVGKGKEVPRMLDKASGFDYCHPVGEIQEIRYNRDYEYGIRCSVQINRLLILRIKSLHNFL